MNRDYFGDSYDLVKRFFCAELRALGYSIVIDPMFTGAWDGGEEDFFHFIGVPRHGEQPLAPSRAAVLFDPDTGVHPKAGPKHLSVTQLAQAARNHALVFSFHQSFSWQRNRATAMQEKLAALRALGCAAMYYDSHASFLFAAVAGGAIQELHDHLVKLDMPKKRLVVADGIFRTNERTPQGSGAT